MKKGLIILGTLIGIITFVMVMMNITIEDHAMVLKKEVEAQQEVTVAYFDNMYKTIAQEAQIADHNLESSKEAFKDIFVSMMEERYKEGEAGFMKWVKEANPDFDLNATSKLFENLQRTVEAKRDGFFMENKKLISMNKNYEQYCEKTINSFFIDNYEKIEIIIVTSNTTKNAFETGEENDIDLF